MVSPLPPAPAGFEEPIWRHDTIDVLMVIDRQDWVRRSEGDSMHPIDRFVSEASRTLQVLGNHATLVMATDEIRYEEELPTAIFSVITNDERFARWCRSWGGRLVEITSDGEDIVLSTDSRRDRFGPDQLHEASSWTLVALDQLPEPADDRSGDVQIRPLRFLSRLDDRDRLSVTRNGIETMLAELGRLLEWEDLGRDAAETAETLRDHLLGFYRMESPPPVEAVDGAMAAAARLVYLHSPFIGIDGLDEAIQRLLEPRAAGDADGLVGSLEVTLEVAAEAGRLARLRGETLTGLAEGYRKLVAGAVVAGGAVAFDGLQYLATNRSYISALIEWLFSAMA